VDRDEEMAAAIERAEAEDTEESAVYVRPVPPKDAAQVYSIRVPVERLEQLRAIASDKGVPPSTLMRRWVIERIEIESPRMRESESGSPRAVVIHLAKPSEGDVIGAELTATRRQLVAGAL
jgi:hypothetical protein